MDLFQRQIGIASHPEAGAFYRGRRVLVVGADGFLGMNLIHALHQLGAEISIISRREQPRAEGYVDHVFRGDLMDDGVVTRAVEGQSVVFALAGVSSAILSNKDPERSLQDECLPNLRLFRACEDQPEMPMVLFASTRLVYGVPQYLPVDEKHPAEPLSVYAAHKMTMEHYLRIMGRKSGLPFSILRISNPYGPYQPLESKSYGVINHFIRLAAAGKPIRIFGDGSQLRDYVFIDDITNAFLMVAATDEARGETFNLGGCQPISIASAAKQISALAGSPDVIFEPWPEDYKSVETGDYFTDLSKLNDYIILPEQTDFAAGVEEVLSYYQAVLR